MKAAVTGSKGMIGRHMVSLLANNGVDCKCLTRKDWDLTVWKSFEELDALFENVDVVFHFGASLPEKNSNTASSNLASQKMFDANVRSCMNLAEWAVVRKIPLVFLSGATVYSDPYADKISEEAQKVVNGFGGFYGYSKLLAENIFEHFVVNGLKIVILRPSSVYGEGLGDDKLIPYYLQMASQKKQIEIDSPDNRINLIHALDVAKAAYLAFKKQAWGVYNIAADYAPTIQELAQLSIKVCGGGGVHLKDNISTEKSFIRYDLDASKAKSAFSFVQSVSIEDGLKLMKENRTF